MPRLNWLKTELLLPKPLLKLERLESPDGRISLRMQISSQIWGEFLTSIEAAWSPESPELRHDLPEQWSIFWKARDGESRLLLAKPELGQWVATIAVGREDVPGLLDRLKSGPGEIDFAKELALHRVSNFNLILIRD